MQSLLGMKFNLVGDTTGLPLATTGSGLHVLKLGLDCFNRIWWEPSVYHGDGQGLHHDPAGPP